MSQQRANSFSIIELIKYARDSAQTGRLVFLEDDRPNAELYFSKGHLRHAQNPTLTGDNVVYQMVGKPAVGEVRWERNIAPLEVSIDQIGEMMLLGALGIWADEDAETGLPPIPAEFIEPAPVQPAVTPPVTAPASEEKPAHPGQTQQLAKIAQPGQTQQLVKPEPPAETTGLTLDGAEQLRRQLGDEVLRPPRFQHWTGLPLPFVSAFAFEPEDGSVKTAYDLLWKAGFSGFVTANLGHTEGFSLLYRGRIVHSRFAEEASQSFSKDMEALNQLSSLEIQKGENNGLLIYPLEPEFVHSYSALIIGEAELNGLSSLSVKINKLLNTLEQGNRTGVVHITNSEENGYIFLNSGRKLGSYYEVEEVLEESILRVYQIVGKTDSIIDVLIAPSEDKLFDYARRPHSVREIKREIVELAEETFGKGSNRIVQLLIQSEETLPALISCCNQARRVAEMSNEKALAEQFYERAMLLLQELN